MFGSHSPICNLSVPLSDQIDLYNRTLLPNLSVHEKNLFFHDVANDWFLKPSMKQLVHDKLSNQYPAMAQAGCLISLP